MTSRETISVQLNGESIDVPFETSIKELLELASVRSKLVVVEINMTIVPREQHEDHRVVDGDEIEVVTLVGGG